MGGDSVLGGLGAWVSRAVMWAGAWGSLLSTSYMPLPKDQGPGALDWQADPHKPWRGSGPGLGPRSAPPSLEYSVQCP